MLNRHSQEAYALGAKTMAGHKGRRQIGITYVCECGWTSCTFFGQGATTQAAAEFQWHKRTILCETGVIG